MGELIIVDRIESDMAACELESRELRMIPLAELPQGVSEGDCLRFENGRYIKDEGETRRRREANIDLWRKLTNRGG